MLASMVSNLLNFEYWLSNPWLPLMSLFQLWMFIDAVRRREWIWAFFIMVGFGISAMFYYFAVYRTGSSATRGFELPGAHHRRQIKDLQAKIHHLDKAHHHFQLGDIYFQQGKLVPAESCYRASLERDPQDIDTRAHLGQCLLRQKRAAEARPLLEGVIAENPKHDYGYSLMALAETLTALDQKDAALDRGDAWVTLGGAPLVLAGAQRVRGGAKRIEGMHSRLTLELRFAHGGAIPPSRPAPLNR
jgi:tetratricopeptide (TPR) repeat protein